MSSYENDCTGHVSLGQPFLDNAVNLRETLRVQANVRRFDV